MIMHKISYIICKKYNCRHGEILVNATGLSPVEKSCGFESTGGTTALMDKLEKSQNACMMKE